MTLKLEFQWSTKTTTHVLFEGHPLCGFMAGTLPSGWPDGHNWVSIAEVMGDNVPIMHDACKPCERCVSLVASSSFSRSRA